MKTYELFQVLGYLNTGLSGIIDVIFIVLGLVVVRPAHATAGLLVAAGGAVSVLSTVFLEILSFASQHMSGSRATLSILNMLISLIVHVAFWGAIAAAAYMLAGAIIERKGRVS